MVEVSTSILTLDENTSIKTLYKLETAKTDYFHIDVMDGKFVKNNTLNAMWIFTNQIRQISNLPLDIHLMVDSPKKYINKYIALNPCFITIHKEAFKSIDELIEMITYIKNQEIKVGVAIKPSTKVNEIFPILHLVNLILVMTVEPGYGRTKNSNRNYKKN